MQENGGIVAVCNGMVWRLVLWSRSVQLLCGGWALVNWMGYCLQTVRASRCITNTKVNSVFHPSGQVNEVHLCLGGLYEKVVQLDLMLGTLCGHADCTYGLCSVFTLCIVQIATKDCIYIYDKRALGDFAFLGGLCEVFESSNVWKVYLNIHLLFLFRASNDYIFNS